MATCIARPFTLKLFSVGLSMQSVPLRAGAITTQSIASVDRHSLPLVEKDKLALPAVTNNGTECYRHWPKGQSTSRIVATDNRFLTSWVAPWHWYSGMFTFRT